MPLEIGSTLNLQLREVGGGDLDLTDYRGTSNVFVYFMRALSCAQCNSAVRTLTTQQDELAAAGVQVIVAVPEDEASATAWKTKRGVPFPVVIGRGGTAHAEAGLLRKVFGAIQQSGGVLLDKEGTVRYSHISTNPGASYNKADLAAAIDALSAGAAA
ncbi:redoxin domain-containing protein [Cryobacterium algoricola]|uniref:Redoxin domain-containing protein n=1 Tax=Cryobacterium algoricola TaxID=1259183 RepID=A0ABY2IBU0_9MICO|nr:redoxin domain-containing protein [Cryobacterium algoricola]TFB84444.1 redoxin domain-containing protein [Cryobacterium algoricola]